MFSDDSKLLACHFGEHIAVYSADSGHLLWSRLIRDIGKQFGIDFNEYSFKMGWPAGSDSLIAYHQPEPCVAAAAHAHLLKIDVQSGAVSLGPAICFDLSDMPPHVDYYSDADFSPDATCLDIRLYYESEHEMFGVKPFKLLLVAAASGTVALAGPFDFFAPNSCWAANSRLYAVDEHVFDIAQQTVTRISKQRMGHMTFDDRSQPQWFGFTQYNTDDAIVISLQSHDVLLSVPESTMIGFASTKQLAVTRPRSHSGSCLQVWDTLHRHRLFQINLSHPGFSQLSFVLSDLLLAAWSTSFSEIKSSTWCCWACVNFKWTMACKGTFKKCIRSRDDCCWALVQVQDEGHTVACD